MLRPYLEGSAGFQRFFTRTYTKERGFTITFFEEDSDVNPRFDKQTLHSDWGWTMGGTAGLKIILGQKYQSALDLQIAYRQGAAGRFYIRNAGANVEPEPLDNFDRRRAALSMVSFKIGFSILAFSEN